MVGRNPVGKSCWSGLVPARQDLFRVVRIGINRTLMEAEVKVSNDGDDTRSGVPMDCTIFGMMHSPMAGSGVRCAQCAYVRMHTRQSKDTPPLASSARADPHAPATAAPFPDFLSAL